MNIIVACILLVVCLLDLSSPMRLRENSNVLVPSNDVNLHAKIKKLLSGDEVDPEDFNDNEIQRLSEMKFPKVEKLRIGRNPTLPNKVFDDKNKNIEENQIDHESNELVSNLSDDIISLDSIITSILKPHENHSSSEFAVKDSSDSFNPIEAAPENITNFSSEEPTTPKFNCTDTVTCSFGFDTTPNVITPSPPTNLSSTTTELVSSPSLINATTPSPPTSLNSTTTELVSSPSSITTKQNETTPLPPTTLSSTTTESVSSPSSITTKQNETTPSPPTTLSSTTTEAFSTSLNTNTSSPSTTPSSSSTIATPSPDNAPGEECLLGKAENYLQWLNKDGSLDKRYIENSCPGSNDSDLYFSFAETMDKPLEMEKKWKYLSFAGKNCSDSVLRTFTKMPELLELDLRNCNISSLPSKVFNESKFPKLKKLFLSNNNIKDIHHDSLPPTLEHLDLSYNLEQINLEPSAFKNLKELKVLDLSFTKLKNSEEINSLLDHLIGLSLCFSFDENLKINFQPISIMKKLDISGIRFENVHSPLPASLEALTVRNSTIVELSWVEKLENLEYLDLSENDIITIHEPFRNMANLREVNLKGNRIDRWNSRLFINNNNMKFLDLSNNELVDLTPSMEQDLMSVQFVALGNNRFECNCHMQTFMNVLFKNTLENSTHIDKEKETENEAEGCFDENKNGNKNYVTTNDNSKVSLGLRNQIRPQYDVMSRTYQKYYDMAKISVEAMNADTSDTAGFRIVPRSLVMRSNVNSNSGLSMRTVLFDYGQQDDGSHNYFCFDAKSKSKQDMLKLDDLCYADQEVDDVAVYINKSLLMLSISFSSVIICFALLFVIYWKWWYIKYFFVLFKNTAILAFMDDSDGEKEEIVKEKGDDIVDVYLYDVFVSYSDQNRNWVLDEFIPNVERRETINVCLHERDFQVGCGILENIVSCMDRSRCLLLLISENFLLSQWCQFEMNLAQHRLLETRREKLILVILEDIPAQKQPRTLKYLMRTKTYIKWPVNGTSEDKQVFWKRLKKAIISSKWENDSYGSIV